MPKNIDYSASAERLTNPESVRLLLLMRLGLNDEMALRQRELKTRNIDLMAEIESLTKDLAANEAEIRNTVLADGGYQDCDAGLYALRQKRVSYTYDPERFKVHYPLYAPAVIKEIVDVDKLKGLIKGGLIKMENLLHPDEGVATEEVSFAFILKVEVKKE